jgi:hypothetical protein
MKRRRISDGELARWFQFQPAALPFAAGEHPEVVATSGAAD